jgi:hypothetical protein
MSKCQDAVDIVASVVSRGNSELICDIWFALTQDAKAMSVFKKASIHSVSDLTRIVFKGDDIFFVAYSREGVLLAVVWVNCFIEKTANAHFVCFKSAYGCLARRAVKRLMLLAFSVEATDGTPFINTLIGRVSIENKLAIRFIKQCGMKEVGVVKNGCYDYESNKSVDALVTYSSREDFIKEVCDDKDLY